MQAGRKEGEETVKPREREGGVRQREREGGGGGRAGGGGGEVGGWRSTSSKPVWLPEGRGLDRAREK